MITQKFFGIKISQDSVFLKLAEILCLKTYASLLNYKYTAEQLFSLPETKERLDNYGEEEHIALKIKLDLARTENYQENIFYHGTGGTGETGVGQGLYLSKDKNAINNFYNSDGEYGKIETYIGSPEFIDLAVYSDFEMFEKEAIEKFGKQKHCNHLKALTLLKGFDGIRYYDPLATGEEFVLYNTEKITISANKKSRKKNLESIIL